MSPSAFPYADSASIYAAFYVSICVFSDPYALEAVLYYVTICSCKPFATPLTS